MKKIKAVLRWTGRTLLVLLATFALFILEENIRGRIMLSRYKAELRANGEKLTLAELNLPKPSLETNGAAALLAIADQVKKDAHETRETGYIPEGLVFVRPGVAVVMHKQRAPVVDSYPSGLLEPCGTWDDDSNITATVDTALEQAEQIVRQRPVQFVLDYSEGAGMRLPHLHRVRYLSEWFAGNVLVKLHNGNIDGAMESLEDVRKLTDSIADERVQICQLERINCEKELLSLAWELVHADKVTDAELACLQQICTLPDVTDVMQQAFEMQVISHLRIYRLMRERGVVADLRESLRPDRFVQGGWKESLAMPVWLVWRFACLDQDERRALELWYAILQQARDGNRSGCWVRARAFLPEDPFPRRPQWFYDRWRYGWSQSAVSVTWRRSALVCYRLQSERELTLAAIAVKRFELRSGRLPAELQALVPEFLSRVPVDYMDGNQLRYRLNGNGTFTLYSVGDDGADDGGNPSSLEPRMSLGSIWYGRDAVWPVAATQEEVEAMDIANATPGQLKALRGR